MTATLTTVSSLLKEMYEGTVNTQFNEETITLKRIEKTAEGVEDNIGGQHVIFPVRTTRNNGISYRAEGGQLAAAGRQGYAAAQENLMYGYGRFAISGQAMKLAETKPQTFMATLDSEMDGLKSDLVKDSNRISWGHEDSASKATGIIAKLSAYTSGTPSITVDYPRRLEIGMAIDIINGSNGAVRGSVTVESIVYSTGVVTISDTVTSTASGDYVCRTGNYGLEPYGIMGLVGNTGTIHNINSATAGNEYWQSTMDTGTNTLTEQAMITMCDNIQIAGGNSPTAAFCSLGVRRAYHNIQLSIRRYVDPVKFDGGLVGLSFNTGKAEIPLVADPDAPSGTMAMLDEKELKIFRQSDWRFEDADGNVLKWKDDYDEFQGLMKKYWQVGTHKRNAHGMFTAITEPTA
jgi:hypothetical protein